MVDVQMDIVHWMVAQGPLTMPEAMAALYICCDELAKMHPYSEVMGQLLKAKAHREREGW